MDKKTKLRIFVKRSFKMKRTTVLMCLLLAALVCSCNKQSVNKQAQKETPLAWEMNDGELIIYAQGPLRNYSENDSNRPWSDSEIITVIIKDGVTHIGNNAFKDCANLVSVSIPNSVLTIGESAFKDCTGLSSIIIPDGVLNIENSAFENCEKLITIDIPDSVLNIGDTAFMGCNSLLSISLGKNVKAIGEDAFYGCGNVLSLASNNPVPPYLHISELESRYYSTSPSGGNRIPTPLGFVRGSPIQLPGFDDYYSIQASPFYSFYKKCNLIIPDEFIASYRQDTEWNRFFTKEEPEPKLMHTIRASQNSRVYPEWPGLPEITSSEDE